MRLQVIETGEKINLIVNNIWHNKVFLGPLKWNYWSPVLSMRNKG